MEAEPLLRFRLDRHSAVPVYRQLVDQVRRAIRLGILRPGDQLPSVRDVVGQVAINPNTVHRAYLELEHQGLIEGEAGRGTFVRQTLPALPDQHEELQRRLAEWFGAAQEAGIDDESVEALIAEARRLTTREEPS
jgi:GntR family transcriptional regulator